MFENILGNDKIKKDLEKSLKNNRTSHSYMFIGEEGIGKKEIAKEFSKSILCLNNVDGTYCNKCKSCLEFNSANHPDFKIIEPEGNTLKIDQIREFQKKVSEKPIVGSRKVYIINDSDKMTSEAQNCLLKTLEEPPEFVTIILIGSNESAFLSTIKSRCMILHFEPIQNELLKDYLEKKYNIIIKSQTMLETFQGSIGKALQLVEKQEIYEKIEEIIQNLENKDIIDILKNAEIIYKEKDEIYNVLEYINIILLNLAKQKYKYAECIEIVENTKKRLKSNANYDMSIDNMLIKIKEKISA